MSDELKKTEKYLHNLLRKMAENGGSDLYIAAGARVSIRVNGKIQAVTENKLTPAQTQLLSRSLMNERQWDEYELTNEANFAISVPGVSRFRVNTYRQRGSTSMVLRYIPINIPSLESLQLPPVLKDIVMAKRGLIICVGATGQGKSTSLAALLDYRNTNSSGHILTVEDPVEFMHQHKGCLVSQREVGTDTDNFHTALKNSLRQAPDVIVVGEVRDRETMEHVIEFAETGHLCLMTLHANNSNQALERIINFFPESSRNQILLDLSLNVKMIMSQRLVSTGDESRRVAVEVLLNTPLMSDLIYGGKINEIKELIAKSKDQNMQTFDQALFDLIQEGTITLEEGLRHADSQNDLRLKCKLANGQSDFGADNRFDLVDAPDVPNAQGFKR